MDNIIKHIKSIKDNWYKLPKLPKLSIDEIFSLNEPLKMAFLYYYAPMRNNEPQMLNHLYSYTLLDLNSSINRYNDTLYLLIAFRGNIKLLKYLKLCGVETTSKNIQGDNAIFFAIYGGHIKTIKYLKSQGFDINMINNAGENALLIAVAGGHLKTLKYLESRGLNINIKNFDGENAYFIAAQYGHIKIMKYLDSLMICNFNITNNFGETVYICSIINNKVKVLKYLDKYNKQNIGYKMYMYAIKYNKIKIIKYFTTITKYLPPLSDIIEFCGEYSYNLKNKEKTINLFIKKYQISNSKYKLIYI